MARRLICSSNASCFDRKQKEGAKGPEDRKSMEKSALFSTFLTSLFSVFRHEDCYCIEEGKSQERERPWPWEIENKKLDKAKADLVIE